MNLNPEPHCGTDLGLLRTRAVPKGDGSYAISGQKDNSFPPANTTCRKTSSTWCWPAFEVQRRATRGVFRLISIVAEGTGSVPMGSVCEELMVVPCVFHRG